MMHHLCPHSLTNHVSCPPASKRRKKVNPNGSGGGSNGGGNGHSHSSNRGCGGSGPGSAMWLRPIHNLLQHHQHQHCRLSNGGQHTVAVAPADHEDGEGREELEMKSLSVRRGSTNGNSGGRSNPAAVAHGMGALLRRLNGGMNYPTILPSFVCSYSSKTPPPHSQQCGASSDQHPSNHSTAEHTETLNKLYQLMGQHSKTHMHRQTHRTPRGSLSSDCLSRCLLHALDFLLALLNICLHTQFHLLHFFSLVPLSSSQV